MSRPDWDGSFLFAELELVDSGFVGFEIGLLEVFEKFFAFADHLEEAAFGHEVVGVGLDVGGDFLDAGGEDGDLDLGGADVLTVAGKGGNSGRFVVFCNHIMLNFTTGCDPLQGVIFCPIHNFFPINNPTFYLLHQALGRNSSTAQFWAVGFSRRKSAFFLAYSKKNADFPEKNARLWEGKIERC